MGELIVLPAPAAPALRTTRLHGRYANTVRVASPQGSAFDGRSGRVVKVEGRTAFVRLSEGTLPFGIDELEVLS
jgi:hypothetical protein